MLSVLVAPRNVLGPRLTRHRGLFGKLEFVESQNGTHGSIRPCKNYYCNLVVWREIEKHPGGPLNDFWEQVYNALND